MEVLENFKLLEHKLIRHLFEACDLEIPHICFANYFNFAKIEGIINLAKFYNAFVKPQTLNQITCFKAILICLYFESLKLFFHCGAIVEHFPTIAHQVARSEYFDYLK